STTKPVATIALAIDGGTPSDGSEASGAHQTIASRKPACAIRDIPTATHTIPSRSRPFTCNDGTEGPPGNRAPAGEGRVPVARQEFAPPCVMAPDVLRAPRGPRTHGSGDDEPRGAPPPPGRAAVADDRPHGDQRRHGRRPFQDPHRMPAL